MPTADDKMALRIDLRSHTPIFAQLVDGIKFLIATGKLVPGDQILPVRKLAENLNVNPNTVDKAYQELLRQDIVEAKQGRGTFVKTSEVELHPPETLEIRQREAVRTFINTMVALGLKKSDILTALIQQLNMD